MILRYWPLALALLIVLSSGIAHGLWSDRWATTNPAQLAAERLTHIPATLGAWQGTDLPFDATPRQRAELAGWLQRRYVHRTTQQELLVVLLCGRPGPIAVHTPDVCYPGVGYRTAAQQRKTVAQAPLWESVFVKETFPTRDELRVWWTWYAGDAWQVAAEPRLAFARYPVLYKLYVIHRSNGDPSTVADPCPEFLQQFLPQVSGILRQAS